jgi:hypothetical protein
MELNDSDDLIKFINKEKKNKIELDLTHSYKIFCRSLPKIISLLYKKTCNINNINIMDVINLGVNMYFNIYWFILRYTNNCDVALFLSETSINLFVDSAINSYETTQDNPFNIKPNISDSIRFAYKKTIGPLQCDIETNVDIDRSQTAAHIVKMFIVQIMLKILSNGILVNNKKDTLTKDISPKIEIVVDFIQNQNKQLIQNIWQIIYFIINKNSEEITNKLYHQINHYIDSCIMTYEEKKIIINEMDWIHFKQRQILTIYNNTKALIDIIKDLCI